MTAHEKDIALAEVIGMCLGSMTADGAHAVLYFGALRHQQGIKAQRCGQCTPGVENRNSNEESSG